MKRWLAVITVSICVASGLALRAPVHGFTLVVRAADLHGIVRHLADLDTVRIANREIEIPLRDITLRARVYAPISAHPRQTVLLVPGLHPSGVDEPRLMRLASRLSEAGIVVVTPDIPELSEFEITPLVTDRIERAGVWLANDSGLAPSGRIGLIGVSFSGGLAVVAAGRPALRDRLLYVFSFGGHDDLPRVLNYLCSGVEADGIAGSPPPHDYGEAVVLLNVAPRVVPPDQVVPLRAAVRRFLLASYLDVMDKPRAAAEFAAARDLERTLPEPSATLLRYVNTRDVSKLGPILQPAVDAYVQPPALSPDKSPMPFAPVYLLHGRSDSVIPSAESEHLAHRLASRVAVHLLITDLISHAEADQPAHTADVARLSLFFGRLLGE